MKVNHPCCAGFLAVSALLAGTEGAAGQEGTYGELVAIVRDTADRPIYDVAVRVTPLGSTTPASVRLTDFDGSARVPAYGSDRYEVHVSLIGYDTVVDTVPLAPGQSDTLRYQLIGDRDIMIGPRTDFPELLDDTTQPHMSFERARGSAGDCSTALDSLLVFPDSVVLVGRRYRPNTNDEFEPLLRRTGGGLVLDLEHRWFGLIGHMVTCVQWRATITQLRPVRYFLTVRDASDPSAGPAIARVLWAGSIDLRRPEVYAVPEGETFRRR